MVRIDKGIKNQFSVSAIDVQNSELIDSNPIQGVQQPGKPQGKPGKPGKLREFFCLSMRIF